MKNKILTLIEAELNMLINEYQKQITILKTENSHLHKEIQMVRKEKLKTVEHEINPLDILFSICKDLVLKDQLEAVDYILERMLDYPDYLINISTDDLSIFHETILKLLNSTESNDNKEFLLETIIDILTILSQSNHRQLTTDFLKQNFSEIFHHSCNQNILNLILKNLRLFLHYDLFTELKEVFAYLLKVEWSFIEHSLKKSEFNFLLWYAFLLDVDEKFLNQCTSSKQWFNGENLELDLYFYLGYVKTELGTTSLYALMRKTFLAGTSLEKYEKELILEKVESLIDKSINTQAKTISTVHNLYLINDADEHRIIEKFQLRNKKVYIPLYRSKNVNIIDKKISSIALVNHNYSDGYITVSDYQAILKTHAPLLLKTNKQYLNFKWPSTEISSNNSNIKENTVLNENSDLKQMGYQITGLSREGRWDILTKAVPKLGLKKVTYTIAYNVRLRKGQKNGLQKYEHAIKEWEHDLQKLRNQYYNNNFIWPRT
ncbi:hypothetical protein [Solibacillus daqui]|uniref:hypothetical protein n=1 Tax=Solibacillus daqui TaxID=2912187 RepID=UPI0023673BBA|nr:hypothetical protein [Solibacillus daqui]